MNQALPSWSVIDPTTATTGKRILVVDDEPAMRWVISELLADEGYLVSQACDGAQALEHLRLFETDIIILDVEMPVMNGWELALECHQVEGCQNLPILLLSARPEFMARSERLVGLGISACLAKPFALNELLALVERHVVPELSRPAHPAATASPHRPVRLLLAHHEPIVTRLARLTLQHGMYDIQAVSTAAQALTALAAWQPHVLLLDLSLASPEIMDHVGSSGPDGRPVRVIGVMQRGDLKSTLAAFEAGVEDILAVPFAPGELLARVIRLVRRSYDDAGSFTPSIKLGELEIDILNRTVRTGASELRLTGLEQSLLYLLAANADQVVTCKEIQTALWGEGYVNSRKVDWHVRNLRARLQVDRHQPRIIATVPGGGYRFGQHRPSARAEALPV